MKNSPVLSVIVPIYNVDLYLEECIESILAQSFVDYELILVDDGSTDNSSKICDEYRQSDQRIKVLHKTNGGLSSARNVGMEVAIGKYISFIDSDDWLGSKELFLNAIMRLENNKNLDFVQFPYWAIEGDEIKYKFSIPPSDVIISGKTAILDNFIDTIGTAEEGKISQVVWNKIYRKTFIDKFRFIEGRIYEDMLFSMEYITSVRFALIMASDSGYYAYRIRAGSITHNKDIDPDTQYSWFKHLEEVLLFHNKHTKKPDIQYECICRLTRLIVSDRLIQVNLHDYEDFYKTLDILKHIKIKRLPKKKKLRAIFLKIFGWKIYFETVYMIQRLK